MPFRRTWITVRLAVPWLCLCVVLKGATGAAVPQLSAFDKFVNRLLAKWQIPGAALGVSRYGRLILARAYGMADIKARQPTQPDSLFRIAGISRTITAAAVLRLVEEGKVSLDGRASAILPDFAADSRANHVTVRELLQGGPEQPGLVNCDSRQAGSDDAYRVLGRIIEKASGQSYESFVKSAVLKPLGISRMQIGRATLHERAQGEVHYYDFPGALSIRSVPRPYRAVNLEALGPGGGWIASVFDLMRFADALDGRRPPMLLQQKSLREMIARPTPVSAGAPCYTGLGWMIQPAGEDANWWNSGGFPGTSAYVFRQAATGVDVVLLFNSRPAHGGAFEAALSAGVIKTASSIVQWPATDQLASGPELFARDVVNAADYSGGGVTPGEIVVAFPSNAGPSDMVPWGLEGNLRAATPTGETRVLFDNLAAPVFYSVSGQAGVIVPREVAGKKTTEVVVEYQGKRSPPVTLAVIDSAPALFTLNASGKGQAAMLNETGCCNSVRNPALRGTAATLYATGEGRTSPGRIARNISVTVGGVPAEILYTGQLGVLQVNFRVPANAPVGDTVPLVLTVGNRRSSPDVTMAVRSARQRVLVMDDDTAMRNRLARILEGAGYEILTVRQVREGGAQAKAQPDLVILDLALPEEDSLEVIRTIRKAHPPLKIIAMSGAFGPDALRAADLVGAQAVLTKPLNTETVLSRVRTVLQRKAAVY
jgi:uncharacterized protein (TIGR03437 family)